MILSHAFLYQPPPQHALKKQNNQQKNQTQTKTNNQKPHQHKFQQQLPTRKEFQNQTC